MIIHKHVRTLASASLLALAVASVPMGFVHAAIHNDRQSCQAAGFVWMEGRGCIDKTCSHGGRTYQNGEGYRVTVFGGQHRLYVCDGVTGQFVIYRTADPQGPLAPHTTTGTNAPPEQAPANPVVTTATGTYSQPTQPTPTPVVPRTIGTFSQQ